MWKVALVNNSFKSLNKIGTLLLGKQFREKAYRDMLMEAQAKADARKIEAGELRFDGTKLIPDAHILYAFQEEASNLNKNLAIAVDILRSTPDNEVSDEDVDIGWFNRWRNEAKLIADKDMQSIWGRILAEEVKNPGGISCRTLDVIKNLSPIEARIFDKVSSFVIEDTILPFSLTNKSKVKSIINYSELQSLQESGLIVSSTVGSTIKSNFNKIAAHAHDFSIVITDLEDKGDKELWSLVAGPSLTCAGIELLHIIACAQPTKNDLELMFNNLLDQCFYKHIMIEVYLHDAHGNIESLPLFRREIRD